MEKNISVMTESEKEYKKPEGNQNLKISKEIIDKVCQEIARGVPVKYACMIGGISKETYYRWIRLGKEEDDDSDSLYKYIEKKHHESRALAVASRVEKIRVDNSWQSAAWWLERMAHEDFGKKQTLDANVNANVKSEDISKLFDNDKVSKILNEEKDIE